MCLISNCYNFYFHFSSFQRLDCVLFSLCELRIWRSIQLDYCVIKVS